MRAFAALLERLAFTPGHEDRIALLGGYFATTPDPDRGFGLAVLAGGVQLPTLGPRLIRTLAEARTDPVLFALSHDYVGDLAETVALLWPDPPDGAAPPALAEVIGALAATPRAGLPDLLASWLDAAEAPVRSALLTLVTGGPRAEVSGPLARRAVAAWGGLDPAAVEEVWHGLAPPYEALFAWAEGRAPRPDPGGAPLFRPPMLAHAITAAEVAALDPAAFRAEWKWDGLRVQLVSTPAGRRLYSRGADDISAAFPEILAAMEFHAVLDGELLALAAPAGEAGAGPGTPAPFAALQRRLNRLSPSAALLRNVPVGVRLYDLLFEGAEDLRTLPFDARRARLEGWFARTAPAAMDLSPLLEFADAAALARLREAGVAAGSEGLMLKRRDSAYLPGRPRGAWWKWKHDPRRIDAVLMYAERGHSRRGGAGPDYTFGVWDGAALVPVGKACSGFTDAEQRWLDGWVRGHTIARFGPVREVEKALVLEVAFDSAHASPRHKSGIALRFPRIARLHTDKPAAEADRIETVRALMGR
jgi:ATP-dependent DNA ligase